MEEVVHYSEDNKLFLLTPKGELKEMAVGLQRHDQIQSS